jgi:hypothetical protein
MNHKNSWAEENTSPKRENYEVSQDTLAPRRIIVNSSSINTTDIKGTNGSSNEDEILIVASKLKQYIKDKYDLSTSGNVMEVLSNIVRRETDQAARKARSEGRKTVMDRDFE